MHICSRNNFPTAAGLASSASGFAALVASLAALYKLPATPSQLSLIARQGSGSACRSLFGGYVAWEMGSSPDGSDSLAVEVAPQSHWPDIHALICVVSDDKKGTSSTSGMQRTVETSPLLQQRIKEVVPARMAAIKQACDGSRGRHGARKVWHQLRREERAMARSTVERLMKVRGVQGVVRGKTRECPELRVSIPAPAVSDTQASKRSPNMMAT